MYAVYYVEVVSFYTHFLESFFFLSIGVSGVLKSPASIVLLLISPFTTPCIVRKDPRVPHTARRGA